MRNAIVCVVAACMLAAPALAVPPERVEHFEAATWERLQADLPRPSAVVFTATYCATCPAVLAKLADKLAEHDVRAEVIAVVTDEAEDRELLDSGHYERATRLFLFADNEASLRYRIDPRWRGVTPYIALLPVSGKPIFAAGSPSDAQIAAWLDGAQR